MAVVGWLVDALHHCLTLTSRKTIDSGVLQRASGRATSAARPHGQQSETKHGKNPQDDSACKLMLLHVPVQQQSQTLLHRSCTIAWFFCENLLGVNDTVTDVFSALTCSQFTLGPASEDVHLKPYDRVRRQTSTSQKTSHAPTSR